MPDPGALLASKYRLTERIGEGGMGTVWLARNEDLGRDVAIKVLHKVLLGDPNASARFRQEARAAAQIDHPNICKAIDVGEQDDAPFMVMELLRGESLAERLTRERALSPQEAALVMVEVLAALDAAHTAAILHRDLKPENIYLAREGERIVPKILDFGVSKFIGDEGARVKMTRTGALVGTPAYMSPEQALGLGDIDVRSDVWSAGVVLFEMVAGRLPYEASNYNGMLVKIATESPVPVETLVRDIDPVLARIMARMLAHRRDDRLPTARAAMSALRAWLGGTPVDTPAVRVPMPTPRIGTTPMSWAEGIAPTIADVNAARVTHGGRGATRSRWLLPGVLAVVLGVGGVVVLRGVRTGAHASDATPTTRAATAPVASSTARRDEPAAPAGYQLAVLGLPAAASVLVNGVPVQLPARLASGQSARIEVTAPGFERWTQTVVPTGDVALTFEGRAATPPPHVAEAPPPSVSPPAPRVPARAPRGPHGHGAGERQPSTPRPVTPPLQHGVAMEPD